MEFLPGQYDQRADSAATCIRLIEPSATPVVKFARVIMLEGELSESEVEEIKKYCVNPVDSQQASMEKPESLDMETTIPADVAVIEGFTEMNEEELEQFRKDMEFAMSADDIKCIQDYFRDNEKRNPTVTELKVIDTYWSDHCRHTTFNTELTDIYFEDGRYGDMIKEASTNTLK